MTTVRDEPHRQERSPWRRLGFEVELVAPVGTSRKTLADTLAKRLGGSVRSVFHHDTEMSMVKDRPVFHHLTQGFEVLDSRGETRCRLVDDVTILADLDHLEGAASGWFRILSDEPRLLRLIAQLADPSADAGEVLKPVAEAFGVTVEARPDGRYRLDDRSGATVAMVAPQGGERERVCEIITPPLTENHAEALEVLLAPARSLGFKPPVEGATHVHLDAEPFRSSRALARLVRLFGHHREELWQTMGTNPKCRRLSALPEELISGVDRPGFEDQPWDLTLDWLKTLPITKFSDCNLVNLRDATPGKDTVEIRLLAPSIDALPILQGVAEIERRFVSQR